MKQFIEKILNEYVPSKKQTFAGHPMGTFFRNEIPSTIYRTGIVNQKTHLITGSVGQGNWATVPWVCIFDRKITTSATKGVYIVYLMAKDGQTLYLTFNQGCTDIRKTHSKRDTIKIMRQRAAEIASKIDSRGFASDERIDLGGGLTELAELYQKGTIFYKVYKKGAVPSEEEVRSDLQKMMDIYSDYASGGDEWWPSKSQYDPGISKEDWKRYILEVELPEHPVPMSMLKAMLEMGGIASCKQLSEKYGGHPTAYAGSTMNLGRRVKKYFDLPSCMDGDQERFFPFPFVGKYNGSSQDNYLYKMRPELYEALQEMDLSSVSPFYRADKPMGKFDSWEIIDEETAVKTCDKSFFAYNGSAVPRAICWFFDAENMAESTNREVAFIYKGATYTGRVAGGSPNHNTVRIFWDSELSRDLAEFETKNAKAKFVKISTDKYSLSMMGGEKEMTISEQVTAVKNYIAAKGFNYEGDLIENFYLSLLSKPFVILAGTSGTGKTRLVSLFAEAINAKYQLVSVRPDWSDSSDLFGHIDLNGNFKKGAIIDFIKDAAENLDTPYILCLDEMNLARVEYYMSDILSVLETREFDENGNVKTQPIISKDYCTSSNGSNDYGELQLPGNLFIVGTVNMDETTFPFSKKVLDRANTIEFSYVDLAALPAFSTEKPTKVDISDDFLSVRYIKLNDCSASDATYISKICANLQRINNELEVANAHIGYRVRDEIVFYMLNNHKTALIPDAQAFDNQIMQKILPRIQGSSESIKTMLGELLKISESEGYESSYKKISFMIKRYEEDGFTSYWL